VTLSSQVFGSALTCVPCRTRAIRAEPGYRP
jgi:hypothetical protein